MCICVNLQGCMYITIKSCSVDLVWEYERRILKNQHVHVFVLCVYVDSFIKLAIFGFIFGNYMVLHDSYESTDSNTCVSASIPFRLGPTRFTYVFTQLLNYSYACP